MLAPRHLLQRADFVDGVEVSQQENRRSVSRAAKVHLQMIAGYTLAMNPDVTAKTREFVRQVRAKLVAS